MQVRAIKTFNSNLGVSGAPKQLVREGLVITVSDRYGQQIIASRLAVKHVPRENKPERDTDLGGPDKTKKAAPEGDLGNGEDDENAGSSDEPNGEEETDETEETESSQDQESGEDESSSEDRRTAGRTRRSSSQRPARRSRKKT